ncbi:hypothetical protein ACLOJK_018055 [Asimina triloba]
MCEGQNDTGVMKMMGLCGISSECATKERESLRGHWVATPFVSAECIWGLRLDLPRLKACLATNLNKGQQPAGMDKGYHLPEGLVLSNMSLVTTKWMNIQGNIYTSLRGQQYLQDRVHKQRSSFLVREELRQLSGKDVIRFHLLFQLYDIDIQADGRMFTSYRVQQSTLHSCC